MRKKTQSEIINDIANGVDKIENKFCIKKEGEYHLAVKLRGASGNKFIRYSSLSIFEYYGPMTKLNNGEQKPIYDNHFKVLALKPQNFSYSSTFYPATIIDRIEGNPCKYRVKFDTGEEFEVSEIVIVPTEEYWGKEQQHYQCEQKSSSESSASSSEASSDESSTSTYSSYSSNSSDDSSTSQSSDSSDSEKSKKHHKSKRYRRTQSTIIIPVIIPIPGFQYQQYQQRNAESFFPQIPFTIPQTYLNNDHYHKHHNHKHRHNK